MGYACPVCEIPQADARHLANHLAFTALLGNDDHEEWLDEHVPDWEGTGENELAESVVEEASDVGFPQVFEDTTGHNHSNDPRPGDLFEEERRTRRPAVSEAEIDAETAEAIEKAREMTRRARGDNESDGSTADENG